MEDRIVPHNVAIILKENGYPQGLTTHKYVSSDLVAVSSGFDSLPPNKVIDAPKYIDVWKWLWARGIMIHIFPVAGVKTSYSIWIDGKRVFGTDKIYEYDPELAIIDAVNYLMKNNLIK